MPRDKQARAGLPMFRNIYGQSNIDIAPRLRFPGRPGFLAVMPYLVNAALGM